MAESVNAQIADALTEQQLRDARVEMGLRREVFAQLALLESEILSALKSHDPTDFALLARRRQEVQRLMAAEIDPLVTERYQHIATMLDEALMRLALHEVEVVQQVVNVEADEEIIAVLPSERRVRAGVVHGLFPSATKPTDLATTGRGWWERQGQSITQRIGDSLTVGVSLEENLTELSRRVRGTPEQGFQDGLMAKARNDASRLLATQTTNALGEARVAVAERNPAQMMLVHSSVLDSKTSSICISRHGLKYSADPPHDPIGHSISYLSGVPYHPNCRSSMLTVLRNGGPVTDESLSAWLRRRGPAFQEEVLGPTRARMWREGRLGSLRNLVDALTGKPLTLEELGA